MNWFEVSPTARLLAGLPKTDLGARCHHGQPLTVYCTGCFNDRGGQPYTPDDSQGAVAEAATGLQGILWDLQDQMHNLQSAIEQHSIDKKNPPPFLEVG